MIFDQPIELINHHNFEDNVMQLILVKIKWHIKKYLIQKYQSKNKKMYYHNEFDIYYRTHYHWTCDVVFTLTSSMNDAWCKVYK